MMSEAQSQFRKIDIVLFVAIFTVGIFLRITPHAFSPGATLHFLAPLHPQPAYVKLGFDEELYRQYTSALIADGIGHYPGIVQAYIEAQRERSGSILPPVRFLYIFTTYVWCS